MATFVINLRLEASQKFSTNLTDSDFSIFPPLRCCAKRVKWNATVGISWFGFPGSGIQITKEALNHTYIRINNFQVLMTMRTRLTKDVAKSTNTYRNKTY